MSNFDLSVIIPVFNGEGFLEETIKTLAKWQKDNFKSAEIIFVNDGSFDRTKGILLSATGLLLNFQVLNLERNRGKGCAIREGMKCSHGEYVVFTDADLPYGLTVLEEMLHRLRNDKKIGLLYGSRSHNDSTAKNNYGFLRKIGRIFFSVIIDFFVLPDVPDSQCGIKMFSRELVQIIVKQSIVDRFAFDIELFVLARLNHISSEDFPVVLNHRRESSVRLVKDTILMLGDILKIKLRIIRGQYVRN